MSNIDFIIAKFFPCDKKLKKVMEESTETQEEVLNLMRSNVDNVVRAIQKSIKEAHGE